MARKVSSQRNKERQRIDQSEKLSRLADRERNNPLVSKAEASSVVSSAQLLAADLQRIEDAIYRVAAQHHVQAADILAELRRRIR